jgi:hypothetical protein
MAGVRLVATTGSQLSGTGLRTLSQIVAAAQQRVRVERVRISGDSSTSSDIPPLVELIVQTNAGTSASMTVNKLVDGDDETVQTTGLKTFTGTEPTDGGIIKAAAFVSPTGRHEFVFPPGRDLFIKGGTRLGIRVNAAQTNNWVVQWDLEE